MRFMMKIRFPVDTGNEALKDPEFGAKIQHLLTDMNAEAAYFTTVEGQRGGYVVVDVAEASRIPALAEPWFHWLEADVEFVPVMLPQDLGAAGDGIEAAVREWAT